MRRFGISTRNDLPLTKAQQSEIVKYAEVFGMPKEKIYFYENQNTAYGRIFGGDERLHIGLDILPKPGGKGATANARVTMKGAIAHELEGHRAAELAGKTQSSHVLEEAQASIRAARFAVGLSDAERFTLLRDAVERLGSSGIKVRDVKEQLWIAKKSTVNLKPE